MGQQILSIFLQRSSGKFGSVAPQISLLGLFGRNVQHTDDYWGTECPQNSRLWDTDRREWIQLHLFCHQKEILIDTEALHCEAKLIIRGRQRVLTLDAEFIFQFLHSCFCVGCFSICSNINEAEIRRKGSNMFQLWYSVVSRHYCNWPK